MLSFPLLIAAAYCLYLRYKITKKRKEASKEDTWWRDAKHAMWIFRYSEMPSWISERLQAGDAAGYADYLMNLVEWGSDDWDKLNFISYGRTDKSAQENWDICEQIAKDQNLF